MSSSLPAALTPDDPMFALGYAAPLRERSFTRVADTSEPGRAAVAEEVPVALAYNRRPHVVMMTTPADLEDFAIGFSLAEGIVRSASEVTALEVVRYSEGIELHLAVGADVVERLAGRERALVGRTGCGLCGVRTIQDTVRPTRPLTVDAPIAASALWRAASTLAERQDWNREAGALHAAGWATRAGALEVVREDVGRHNALDKVIGALARAGVDPSTGFVVVTSRASYELVQKATQADIPMLAAMSRPTGLAIRLAERSGMTLVGLVRDRTANVYAGALALTEALAR